MKKEIIDANTAVAKASYKLSEISFIYPITPSSTMAEVCDEMASEGQKNIFNNIVDITEMQSEAGVAGALHGSALSGSVSTTFTSSQGLLLMLPNMYKIAGEMLPVVINVASRSLSTHSLNIFCDHSDVMSARQTGFAMLASSNPQESYDFTVASFLTSMESRIPFLHFFDGFRTSHQISTINTLIDEELKSVYPYQSLKEYKNRSLTPNNPKQFGTNECQDIFFQGREKSNLAYDALPQQLEKTFEKLNSIGLKRHHIMEYVGSKNAKYVVCIMASGADTVSSYIENTNDEEIGMIKINLYRPFDAKYFVNLLPKSAQKIAVLDRTKEQGSLGEPLYLDVCASVLEYKKEIEVIGGRYGLGGKEFNPAMVKAIFENLKSNNSKNHFTIGINDDVSNTSLKYDKNFTISTDSEDCLILGLGSDGSVSSAKNITQILGETYNYVSGYFMYDSKKSGGLTRSYISVSNNEINRPYLSNSLDAIIVNNTSFLSRYNVAKDLKANGILIVNAPYKTQEAFNDYVLDATKKTLAQKNASIYVVDANSIANKNDLQGKISTIMQMALFKIAYPNNYNVLKQHTAELIQKSYSKKGLEVINKNLSAIDMLNDNISQIQIDKNWLLLQEENQHIETNDNDCDQKYLNDYMRPVLNLEGDDVSVSKVNLYGENMLGTSKFEKRNVADCVPYWNYEKCIQCGKCTFVCPHAALRAKLFTDKQMKNIPDTCATKKSLLNKELNFYLEVSPEDCLACGLCQNTCPTGAIKLIAKNEMAKSGETIFEREKINYEATKDIKSKIPDIPLSPLKTQFMKPYFEFSGACAGCGETPYIKLLTQLFGDRLIIANATGCSSIYGGSAPTCPYTKDEFGFGTAWANSLFEDNAEFGLGIEKSQKNKRENFKNYIQLNYDNFGNELKLVLKDFLENFDNTEKCKEIYLQLKLNNSKYFTAKEDEVNEFDKYVLQNLDSITKKSVWLVGGDGWAYDIDFGGLDHVFASGENVNILVLDTELYSNTGGQKSKASPAGSTIKFASNGKKSYKKNLALSALQYKDVYVAEVCLGADMNQVVKAFVEAEKYNGVSIIIAYAPCINHGIDMSQNIQNQIDAVKCGYWHLFRYNPNLLTEGKNPLIIDSTKPTANFEEHLMKERRFANYYEKTNDTSLFKIAEHESNQNYEMLVKLQKLFELKEWYVVKYENLVLTTSIKFVIMLTLVGRSIYSWVKLKIEWLKK